MTEYKKVSVSIHPSNDSVVFYYENDGNPVENDAMLYILLNDDGTYTPIGDSAEITFSSNATHISNSSKQIDTVEKLRDKIYVGPDQYLVSNAQAPIPETLPLVSPAVSSLSTHSAPLLRMRDLASAPNRRSRNGRRTRTRRRETRTNPRRRQRREIGRIGSSGSQRRQRRRSNVSRGVNRRLQHRPRTADHPKR